MADNVTGGPTSGGYGSFLGSDTSALSDSTASEPTEAGSSAESGVSEESTTESPETSVGEETESVQETESTDDGTEVSDEEDADYLPDEQAKVFPVEELAKYGKRYGYTLQEIQADPRLQNALKDKINSDIEIAKQRNAATEEEGEEPTLEESTQENLTPEQVSEANAAHFKMLDTLAEEMTSDDMATAFAAELDKAYGGKGQVDSALAKQSAKAFTKFGTNLMMTALPRLLLTPQQDGKTMLDKLIEHRYPEFGDMHEKSFYARTWESVRLSKPEFAQLPAYGAKDSAFGKLISEAAAKIPNLEQTYSHLPLAQRAKATYELVAAVASGQKPTAAVVKQAEAAGKRKAEEAKNRRDLGKSLASGQSKNQFASDSSESPMSEGYRIWKERDSNAFGK